MESFPLAVVLVRTQTASNLGSVARAAKNFGLDRLSLVEPAVLPDTDSARLAAGADDVLARIARFPSLAKAVAPFPVVLTTSSLRARGRTRTIELSELPGFLQGIGGRPAALVFGPERSGLTEDELAHASVCLRLPTRPEFPTLNLSHAVAVVLAVARGFLTGDPPAAGAPNGEELAPAAEIDAALEHWDRALEAVDFYDTGHRDRSLRDWRRIVAARPLSRREVAILRGVANRVLVALRLSE